MIVVISNTLPPILLPLFLLLCFLAYVFSKISTINMYLFCNNIRKNDSFVLSPQRMNFAFWVLNFMCQRQDIEPWVLLLEGQRQPSILAVFFLPSYISTFQGFSAN